jgi:hypothetical protein
MICLIDSWFLSWYDYCCTSINEMGIDVNTIILSMFLFWSVSSGAVSPRLFFPCIDASHAYITT